VPDVLRFLLGYAALLLVAWSLSENRKAIAWRSLAGGLALQGGLCLLFFKVAWARQLIAAANEALLGLQNATRSATGAVFGYLGGATLPFVPHSEGTSFILAFQALPIVLVMSALSAVLFHWGVLPRLVRAFAWLLRSAMGVRGSVGLSTAANVFLGMVEAPLLVRPYLRSLDRAELFALMSAGMAGVAGTVMALYAGILARDLPDALGHILIASLISAPAALVFSFLMVPPGTDPHPGKGGLAEEPDLRSDDASTFDAVVRGTAEGLQLLLQITATLIVFLALVALVNALLGTLSPADNALSMQRILGYLMAPLAWLIGIPWDEAITAGSLLATKTVLNELLAYLEMAALPEGALSSHSRLIMTYALCGFANLGSLGILLGGMAAMVPERRADILALAPRTLVSGTLATLSCGCLVGYLHR